MDLQFLTATSESDFNAGRQLFRAYAASLPFDLSFQGFEEELASIEVQYGAPEGALVLGFDRLVPVACAGIRRWNETTAELKRMYIDPACRGQKLSVRLMAIALEKALQLGYEKMVLDSVGSMKAAIHLYESFGFEKIAPYRFNPFEDAVYMEKRLKEE
ncbi:GNAT family N-acetyltransferase [Niabella soli]|uniref:Acetyltransferase n=1 Tax=Niabella soli DSM 19437 TaxID=929713 RepID=W0EZY2_9BACT|nr:GNAT family N-acetyltransferase [Niabella soli]AHF16365.1 acetyltransferase [Niabella soli DSM 19437]